jgi:2,3-dihydroxybenzoate decarboxylase
LRRQAGRQRRRLARRRRAVIINLPAPHRQRVSHFTNYEVLIMVKRRELLGAALFASSAMQISALGANATAGQAPQSRKRIAVEEGFNIPEIMDESRKFLAERPEQEPVMAAMWSRFTPAEGGGPPAWATQLTDLGEGRIRAMDAHGITMQLLLLSSPGVQIFDPPRAAELARLANDRLAAAIRAHPDRFAGLATIAPQDPEGAARELERSVRQLGLKGALIKSHTKGEYLDERKFWPILEAAESLDVPIYIHPRTPSPQIAGPYVDYGLEGAIWGYAVETSLHALRLIFAGVFDRFPKLTIAIGHMGEGIPFYLERIDNRFLWHGGGDPGPGRPRLKRMPAEYFKDNFVITTSGMNFHAPLLAAHSVLGADRILFAVDYPFEEQEPAVAAMDTAPVSADDLEKIYHLNAERVFKL